MKPVTPLLLLLLPVFAPAAPLLAVEPLAVDPLLLVEPLVVAPPVPVAPPAADPLLLELAAPPVPASFPPSAPASADGVHTPASHAPSGHAVPSGSAGFEQSPVVVSQVPAAWHASIGLHVTCVPLVHVPALHA
jgi:hypothetical protein